MAARPGMDAAQDSVRIYGTPGTLYARCGGVFGISAFADVCMDRWMADDCLNANAAVRTWHERAQRCGFKFLVTQVVCTLTGGPQEYTGRPMDVAHKHLNISLEQWEQFMNLFNDVCAEFNLPHADRDDMNALLISMMDDCVTFPGDAVPPNPGPARPTGDSIYARAGGVYPLALFVDRLVDALLADSRVGIPTDPTRRNEAALKYLLTEVVCRAAGGPEVVTSSADLCKLLVPKATWAIFLSTARVAMDHLPLAVREGLLQVLMRAKEQIVDPESAEGVVADTSAAQVKGLIDAAAGRMLTSAQIAARHSSVATRVGARKRVHGDPRTLYGRGGGVFGLAALSDQLMDRWMANPQLNANAKVARWHTSEQKYGFKFLVTQIMGYMTGGPQRYTGRPIDEAHRHLTITQAQWGAFMRDAKDVLGSTGADARTQRELCAILESFRDQCICETPGVPEPPQRVVAPGTLYARLGGVYPIARFVDGLLDRILGSHDVRVAMAPPRNVAGMKYIVTELVCAGLGGPEVATAKGFADAQLGVTQAEWPAFLAHVSAAAQLAWPRATLAQELVAAVDQLWPDLGEVSEDSLAGLGPEAAAALDECGGNTEQALELLANGWTGTASEVGSTAGASVARCPFTGMTGTCPHAASAAVSAPSEPTAARPGAAVQGASLDERFANAALVLAECGHDARHIAELLRVDVSLIEGALRSGSGATGAVRLLGSSGQQQLDDLLEEEEDLCCPLSLMLFTNPYIASDGFMYDKDGLKALLRASGISPMTREALRKEIYPAKQKASAAQAFRVRRANELLVFATSRGPAERELAAQALERVVEYLEVLKPANEPSLARATATTLAAAGVPVPELLAEFDPDPARAAAAGAVGGAPVGRRVTSPADAPLSTAAGAAAAGPALPWGMQQVVAAAGHFRW